jgi:hypothetical protein
MVSLFSGRRRTCLPSGSEVMPILVERIPFSTGDATESTGVWTQKSIPSLVLIIRSASSRSKGLEAVRVGISAVVTDSSSVSSRVSESLMSVVSGGRQST